MGELYKEVIENTKKGLEMCAAKKCSGRECPYFGMDACIMHLKEDALVVIEGLQKQLNHVVEVNEKNVSELEEIDRQNKELYHRRELEQLVRSQPIMILHTEPVKIEPVSCDFTKMAKAANKAAKSLDEAVRSMEKLNDLSTAVGLGVITHNNARKVVDDPTFRSPELDDHYVCCGDVAQIGKHLYVVRAYGNNCFTDQCGTNIRYSMVDKLYRVRSDCKLMLVWEKAR